MMHQSRSLHPAIHFSHLVQGSQTDPGASESAWVESYAHGDMDKETVFSRDIWLGDNSGESSGFARNVEIIGWTSVGDKRNGAYVGKLCVLPILVLQELKHV